MKSRLLLSVTFVSLCTASLGQTKLGEGSAAGVSLLGHALAEIGDHDGGGKRDFAVGATLAGYTSLQILSGEHLASNSGAVVLASYVAVDPTLPAMGRTLLASDINRDGEPDLVIGAGNPFSAGAGGLRVRDGNSGGLYPVVRGTGSEALGACLANAGDVNGDGYRDVLVGAPSYSSLTWYRVGRAYVVSGKYLMGQGGTKLLHTFGGAGPGDRFGWSVASLDVNHDGVLDFAIGAPYADPASGVDAGTVSVYDGLTRARLSLIGGPMASDYFGIRLSRAGDINGDGKGDLVVVAERGDFGSSANVGTVLAYSGAQLATVALDPPPFARWGAHTSTSGFGRSLSGGTDVTGDGVADVLIGSLINGGHWQVISGASLDVVSARLVPSESGPDSIAAVSDHDGDGIADVLTGTVTANSYQGVVRLYSTFPSIPVGYCTSQTNSLGCVPFMGSAGMCRVSSSVPFNVFATILLNQKPGLLFYGYGRNSTPFMGGTLCVLPPTRRTSVQNSGGATSGNSCTGSISIDFNQYVRSGVDPSLGVGDEVYAQYWSRDPGSPHHTNLTSAMRFLVGP